MNTKRKFIIELEPTEEAFEEVMADFWRDLEKWLTITKRNRKIKNWRIRMDFADPVPTRRKNSNG